MGKWKKLIGKADNDSCKENGVQETGWHLVFKCPISKELRRDFIQGTSSWEDLDDKSQLKEGGWKVKAFSTKAVLLRRWG